MVARRDNPRHAQTPRWPRLYDLAALVAIVACIGPWIAGAGVLDPNELGRMELSRAIAVNAFGADHLVVRGADNSMPTLTDLGAGELPYTAMALSFQLFGLAEWAGRLPSAVGIALAGLSLYLLLSRFVNRRAGLYALVVFLTMPLTLVHARFALGTGVTIGVVTASGASGVALLLSRRRSSQLVCAGLFAAALVGALLCRGLILGVAPPLFAVGVAAFAMNRPPRGVHALGWVLVTAAFGAAVCGWLELREQLTEPLPLSRWVGFDLAVEADRSVTFDRVLRHIGHATFPWSALAIFALAHLARRRSAGRAGLVRVAFVALFGSYWAAYTAVVPYSGALPFPAAAFMAGWIGLALADVERSRVVEPALGLGTLMLSSLLIVDLRREPRRLLTPFDGESLALPDGFLAAPGAPTVDYAPHGEAVSDLAAMGTIAAGLIVGIVALLLWMPAPTLGSSLREWYLQRRGQADDVLGQIADLYRGHLLFLLVVVEAALFGLGAMLYVGRRVAWSPALAFPSRFVDAGLNAWWLVPVGIAGAVVTFVLARDAFAACFHQLGLPRARAFLAVAVGVGGAWGMLFYPAVGRALSPREAFDTFVVERHEGDELGLLGVNPQAAVYHQAGDAFALADARSAALWLEEPNSPRRFLIAYVDDLATINAVVRSQSHRNVVVADARSPQVLLLSSEPVEQPRGTHPLGDLVLDDPAALRPHNRTTARLADRLDLLGWDLIDERGAPATQLRVGRRYQLTAYFKVLRPIGDEYKVLLHLDAPGKRNAFDHAPARDRYPMRSWQIGDVIADPVTIELPDRVPSDRVELFVGFYRSRKRMVVVAGDHDDNRIRLGALPVLP